MSSRARSRSFGCTSTSRGPKADADASAIPAARSVRSWMASIPSVCNREMIVSAANSSGAIVRRASSPTAVEQDRPAFDAHGRQHAIDPPRIGDEEVADGLLGVGRDHVHRLPVALEGPAENDPPLIDEVVHEPRVVVPAVLLTHVAAPVPRPAALEPEDEVVHARSRR